MNHRIILACLTIVSTLVVHSCAPSLCKTQSLQEKEPSWVKELRATIKRLEKDVKDLKEKPPATTSNQARTNLPKPPGRGCYFCSGDHFVRNCPKLQAITHFHGSMPPRMYPPGCQWYGTPPVMPTPPPLPPPGAQGNGPTPP